MKIPFFNHPAKLSNGDPICSGREFLDRFCSTHSRKQFVKPISDIFDFAKDRNVVHLFVGGSFITHNKSADHIDCVMVFNEDKNIPAHTERVVIAGLRIDIFFASLESPHTIDSCLKLLSSGLNGGTNPGVIQIDLYDHHEVWEIKHQPNEDSFEIIKRSSADNSFIDMNEKAGILVSIHGLLSRAEWNMDIAPIASSQGWIFAPFIYDTNQLNLLFDKDKRAKLVDNFRDWIYDIQLRYGNNISVIAHSFGTYIVAAYLMGRHKDKRPLVKFNSLILTGSILNVDFDWEKLRGLSVGSVYNMIAPNDEYIKYMPTTDLKKYFGMSTLFGKSGLDGFTSKTPMLSQSENEIFTHTNTIKRDIIETKWMPYLNANRDALQIETRECNNRK